jgi:signal transduction histidine kinase
VVALESSKLFCHLGPEELTALGGTAREKTFSAGHQIFKEGDDGDGVYIIKEGLVEISALVNQLRHVFSKIGPGDMFGEMAVLDDKPRSASAIAACQTTVYFIPRADMLTLLASWPVLSLTLLREISNRLRDFDRQYLREILQAERLAVVGRFARSIVHDLKNPLNIIGLTAEMVGMSHTTPEMRQRARPIILQQVERITDLISQILEFTQGQPADLMLSPIRYGQFVQHILEELRAEAALKSATIVLEGELPTAALLLNPKRLRRVFHNLLHNALDVMPSGGKVILRFQLGPKELVTEFEDSGPGIAPEIAGRLFEAFATFGKSHGTGLGLSICKQIVEDHHGWISARNEPGRGAVFAFGLPLPSEQPAK